MTEEKWPFSLLFQRFFRITAKIRVHCRKMNRIHVHKQKMQLSVCTPLFSDDIRVVPKPWEKYVTSKQVVAQSLKNWVPFMILKNALMMINTLPSTHNDSSSLEHSQTY